MYRTVADFLQDWSQERESTLKMMERLTDASLGQRIDHEGRTLGFLAWHITMTLDEMLSRVGLIVGGPAHDSPPPDQAAEIVATYERLSKAVLDQMSGTWNDEDLLEEVNMYGEPWKKGVVLSSLVRHEAHHRGQMTVLMRQAGLTVPGVYGPSREEWAAYGMPAMA
jgi:uncharacterized damage-inducible protein DinB